MKTKGQYRACADAWSSVQVLSQMDSKDVTLASMHSISKGFYGECGRRGGYLELMNVNPDVVSEFYKLASINLCSNLNGQICMALVMNPPRVRVAPQALRGMSTPHS